MGIVNVTPDSFSDGGEFLDPSSAVTHAERLVADGADILDIGGESTRPGSEGVDDDVQIQRVVPVIRQLRANGVSVPISIDTRSSAVAAAALDAGADIVNDVSGIRLDPQMPELLKQSGVPFVVMHMQGTPASMQTAPHYADVVADVLDYFQDRADALTRAGVDCDKMIIDPGIGFGKTTTHNLTVLQNLERFVGKWPLMVGPSRKRFLSDLIGSSSVNLRDAGTGVVSLHCALHGANILRVHNISTCRSFTSAIGAAMN